METWITSEEGRRNRKAKAEHREGSLSGPGPRACKPDGRMSAGCPPCFIAGDPPCTQRSLRGDKKDRHGRQMQSSANLLNQSHRASEYWNMSTLRHSSRSTKNTNKRHQRTISCRISKVGTRPEAGCQDLRILQRISRYGPGTCSFLQYLHKTNPAS